MALNHFGWAAATTTVVGQHQQQQQHWEELSKTSATMEFNNNKGEQRPFPYAIEWLDEETNKQLLRDFHGEKTGFVQVVVGEREKWFFPSKYREAAQHFWDFESRPDDVWVATFPRSGTTWTQELVWMVANDLDYEGSQRTPLTQRVPFFEFSIFMHEETKKELLRLNEGWPEKQQLVELISRPCYETLPRLQQRRFIKTHFPFSLLPPSVMEQRCKVVYVARNPRDVAVSFYHLNRLYLTQGYVGDFATYWGYFERDLAPWCPYWAHIREGWQRRHEPNVLFMFYEDMNRDLAGTIRRVAEFLGKSYTAAEVDKLAEHLHIRNFKNNAAVNCEELKSIQLLKSGEQSFVRSGKSDGWSPEYTDELKGRVMKWIEENSKDLEFSFPVQY